MLGGELFARPNCRLELYYQRPIPYSPGSQEFVALAVLLPHSALRTACHFPSVLCGQLLPLLRLSRYVSCDSMHSLHLCMRLMKLPRVRHASPLYFEYVLLLPDLMFVQDLQMLERLSLKTGGVCHFCSQYHVRKQAGSTRSSPAMALV